MDSITENAANTSVQLGLWEAITDLLSVHFSFWVGILVLCIMLGMIFRKNRTLPKARTAVFSLLFYYYLSVLLTNIVGIPNLSEFSRLARLGEPFFNPNLNLLPLHGGFRLDLILNIFLFIPLGFLAPFISKHYQRVKNTLLLGGGLSLAIEIAQLFTLYRATDIDDLITNMLGAFIGYLCFRAVRKATCAKSHPAGDPVEPHAMQHLPIALIAVAFAAVFFS